MVSRVFRFFYISSSFGQAWWLGSCRSTLHGNISYKKSSYLGDSLSTHTDTNIHIE